MTKNVLFIPHGGGPLPLLNDGNHDAMNEALKAWSHRLTRPSLIIVISAHWEEDQVVINRRNTPGLLYDYYGFPDASYQIQYPCTADQHAADAIAALFDAEGIAHRFETERGFDHGVFVPLKIMYPEATIPVLQISLHHSLDPAIHIAIGRALGNLAIDNTLILGSGFSFHNLRSFFGKSPQQVQEANLAFENWIKTTCSKNRTSQQITQDLIDWEMAPAARFCQPREEHLLPLHVCFGAANKGYDEYESIKVFDKQASLLYWAC